MVSNPLTLLFLFSLTTLCFLGTSSNASVAKKDVDMLVKLFNLSSKNSTNAVRILREKGPVEALYRTLRSPDSSSSNVHVKNLGDHSGYFPIKNSYKARMFYLFFESRVSKSDPFILWLSGGPGCSSEKAVFYENGPYHINDDLSLKRNHFGWDKISHLLYVDQPTGTGFSYSVDDRDTRHNTNEISNDLYNFLQAFFEAHPKFAKNDFYISGQSYAGHYIPVLASRIQQGNRANEGIHINLKGFSLGNGFVDPKFTFSSALVFALRHQLISKSIYDELNKEMPICVNSINQCQIDDNACASSFRTCNKDIISKIKLGPKNQYDIRKERIGKSGYDYSKLEKFLALDFVKKSLGVGDIKYEVCSKKIYKDMLGDIMKNYASLIPSLLEDGIKVLLYAGEYDFVCSWIGNIQFANAMIWSGHSEFLKTKLTPYIIDGEKVGMVKSVGLLTFLKVHNAGHSVCKDQPKVSLEMMRNWINKN